MVRIICYTIIHVLELLGLDVIIQNMFKSFKSYVVFKEHALVGLGLDVILQNMDRSC